MVAHNVSVRVVLSCVVVIKEQVPAPLHSTEPTEPFVIPEPARWLEDAYERIVPYAICAVQHGYQRLVVVPDGTHTHSHAPTALHPHASP